MLLHHLIATLNNLAKDILLLFFCAVLMSDLFAYV
jgi:hypothetical protein